MKRKKLIICVIVMVICACSTPLGSPVTVPTNKKAEVMGVDDERRIVRMGAPYLYVEDPDVDWSGARGAAAEMCRQRWGFSGAEPVGRTRRKCLSELGGNCTRWALIGDYRCTE